MGGLGAMGGQGKLDSGVKCMVEKIGSNGYNHYFVIEISITHEDTLLIAAFDIQTGTSSSSSLLLQQRTDQAIKTFNTFGGDMEALASAIMLTEDGRSLRIGKAPPSIKSVDAK